MYCAEYVLICMKVSNWVTSHVCMSVCKCVSVCLIQSSCIGHHILMISPWSNYSAACITFYMWHTISRQLTWASECQPIGCAITPLSDISIITALPCITLKQQGAERKTLSACLMQKSVSLSVSLSPYTFLSVQLCLYIIWSLSLYMSMHSLLLKHLVWTCFSPFLISLFLIISPSHICLPSDFSVFVPHLFVRLEVKHVLY